MELIKFENVDFSYTLDDEENNEQQVDVLKNLNLKISEVIHAMNR